MSKPVSYLGPARDDAARGKIAVHQHVCGLYQTRTEQDGPACRFLQVGLGQNEQCLYIAERHSRAAFLRLLATHGVDVKAATAAGALLVLSGAELRLALGGFTPDRMVAWLEQAEAKALARGFAALRWAADMTWLTKDEIAATDMFTFEAKLNELLRDRKLVALCQYSMEDFAPEPLMAAAETHPLLVYGEQVCDNYYYVPAEDYGRPSFAREKLERFLFNIITRERLMAGFLERAGE